MTKKASFGESIYLSNDQQSILFRVLTTPLTLLYRAITGVRNTLFDLGLMKSKELPGRVISVGNITMGGTGKSPVVTEIAKFLKEQGKKPAILSRGYGSDLHSTDNFVLLNGKIVLEAGSPVIIPDEAMMLSVNLTDVPIIVGSKRHNAARRYLSKIEGNPPTHWILDDGFQHRQIKRDVNIALLDAQNPFGNGKLVPGGILRENFSSLKRADAIVFTRSDENFPTEKDQQLISSSFKTTTFNLMFESGTPFSPSKENEITFSETVMPSLLATAIAEPARLHAHLKKNGIEFDGYVALRDHSRFDKALLIESLGECQSVVTTAKDYWRDPAIFMDLPIPVFVIPLTIKITQSQLESLV